MCRDEIEGNQFVPNADPESLAKAQIAKHETKQLDATGWLAADLHFADIPWLRKAITMLALCFPATNTRNGIHSEKKVSSVYFVLNN